MNKFKVGQRVKIIRTGKIGKIAELDNEDFDKEGRSNNCYGIIQKLHIRRIRIIKLIDRKKGE